MARARGCSAAWATQVARLAVAGAGVCRRCDAVRAVETAEVAGARGCSAAEYCKGAGAAAEYCTGAVWWDPQHPSVGGGAELQERGPRKCTVREQGPQQSTVPGRRSVWWDPQHPGVGGGAEL